MWGINIPIVKFATDRVDPLVFNAVRMALSTVTLGLFALNEWWAVPGRRAQLSWWRFFAFVLTSSLIYPLLFMWGIDATTAGNTALLMSSMPMWTALLSLVFIRERLPAGTWMGLALTFVGTATVATGGGTVTVDPKFLLGNLLILSASICWATATVLSGTLLQQLTPLRLAFWSSLLTTPAHLLITSSHIAPAVPTLSSPQMICAILYSGILSTGVAYATWHYGVRQLGGSHAAVYQNVVTLVAVLCGWLVLRESILPGQVVGGILTIGGLLLMRRSR
jgi:drug/metabolite transporter (DMT)-like permease